jgi:hypothetical protein
VFIAFHDDNDTFVTKLSSDGASALYAAHIAGSESDMAHDIAVDATGSAYVVGDTESSDFPVTPGALQPTAGGGEDAFVCKVTPAGDALEWGTYLGGQGSTGDTRSPSTHTACGWLGTRKACRSSTTRRAALGMGSSPRFATMAKS